METGSPHTHTRARAHMHTHLLLVVELLEALVELLPALEQPRVFVKPLLALLGQQ